MSNLADLAAAGIGLTTQVDRLERKFGAALKPWTKLSTGLAGPLKVGFNSQAWPWAGSIGNMMTGIGAKVMRLPCSNATTLAATQAALDAGLDVVCKVYPGDLPAMREVVSTFGVKYGARVILQVGNEPQFISGATTAQIWFEQTKAMYAGVKAISPLTPVSGPVINASYTSASIAFVNSLVGLGFNSCVDLGDFHPYYQTPEQSFQTDISAFIARLGEGRNIATEVGWSDATGLLGDRSIGNTDVQDTKTCADYYSRYIPLAGCGKLSHLVFYLICNIGDETDTNAKQNHFGVYAKGPVLKPQGVVAKDAMTRIHQTTLRTCGTRGANWYVRGDTPAGPQLWAWNPAAAVSDAIVCDVAAPTTLSIAIAGAAATTRALPAGRQSISVPLGTRSTILSGPGVTFPEFS